MAWSEFERKLYRLFGAVEMDEMSKRSIRKPRFTAMTEGVIYPNELVSMAEEALASKGKVYAKKNDSGDYVCWAVIKLVQDGSVGKKKISHYEAVFTGAAKGYEHLYEEFIDNVKMLINEYMAIFGKAQKFYLDGEEILPDETKIFGKENSTQRLIFGIAMGVLMGMAMHNFGLGICYFLIFSSIGSGEKITFRRKKNKKKTETEETEVHDA